MIAIRSGFFQQTDLWSLKRRVDTLFQNHKEKPYQVRSNKLFQECENFLNNMGSSCDDCTPYDLCLFFAWKDSKGKTPVHNLNCPEIGKRKPTCPCVRRLSHGTVQSKISQLRTLFDGIGRKGTWSEANTRGNPTISRDLKVYLEQIKEEQSKAHATPNQAVPLFLSKLKLISQYIDRKLDCPEVPYKKKYVMARDQALLKFMFFGGDRAADAGRMLSQEIRELPDSAGIIVRHTWGKTHRCNNTNVFSLFRTNDAMVCPVQGLERYLALAKSLSIKLNTGYLFRPMTPAGIVLEAPLSYEAVYDRLKYYLNTLEINDGETPHSLRAGCAITLHKTNASGTDQTPVMSHVGWKSQSSAKLYTRSESTDQATRLAERMANASEEPSFMDVANLPAFTDN